MSAENNFFEQIDYLKTGKNILWLPVIEIYKIQEFDGRNLKAVQTSIWAETSPGLFRRYELDQETENLITFSGAFRQRKVVRGAHEIINDLPRPLAPAISVQYYPYTRQVYEFFRDWIPRYYSCLPVGILKILLALDDGLIFSEKGLGEGNEYAH